jgi:hypothetical protein
VDAEELARFRAEKDDFFATDPLSPLTARQRTRFRGLAYFPHDPAFLVEAELRPAHGSQSIDLVTSSGDSERYRRVGMVRFAVDGNLVTVTVFGSRGGELFVPFRDATSGVETYAGGRYLEARVLPDGRAILDFNYAYNPYCAYGHGWRCPLPPIENHLAVPIRAGERSYPDVGAEIHM